MLHSRAHGFSKAFPNNEHGHDHCLRYLDGNRRRLELRFVDYGAVKHGWLGHARTKPERNDVFIYIYIIYI